MSTNFNNSEMPPKQNSEGSSSELAKTSTNFNNNSEMPPKLRFKMALKAEAAKNSEGSSSHTALPKKAPSSNIINKPETSQTGLKHKSALIAKHQEETKPSAAVREKGHSSKSASKRPVVKEKGESSKSAAKKSANLAKRKAEVIEADLDAEWTEDIPFCPTYYPSKEEFKNPVAYLHSISFKASRYGMCKIVSPLGPSEPPCEALKKENNNLKFKSEFLTLQTGYRETAYKSGKNYTIKSFEEMAEEDYVRVYKKPTQLPPSLVEKDFWKKIAEKDGGTVEYVNGLEQRTAFSSQRGDPLGSSSWNLLRFGNLPQSALQHLKYTITGISDPLLYFGMLFSYIYWSAEPGHLYSAEYHHFGAPRTWYVSPGDASYNFERVVKETIFPEEGLETYEAYDILNFKALLFPPSIMLKNKVPIYKTVQYPGEFVITFPKAYHMSINHGFNCWEAARFATPHWFPFGEEAMERRALYAREQIVPYQELICEEVMHMFLLKTKNLEKYIYRDMKINFATLIRLHHFACEEIKLRGGANVEIAPPSDNIMFCGACRRECYLAYITCKCFPDPICIFHDVYKGCPCKGERVMWVRREILDMQEVARVFEAEDGKILKEVEDLITMRGVPFGCMPRMLLATELHELLISKKGSKKPRTKYHQ